MHRLSVFDVLRVTGAQALSFSRSWLSEPIRTATDCSDAILAMGPQTAALEFRNDESQYRSLLISSLLGGRWAMSGYPVITMGHRTAAALAATRIRPDDAIDFVRAPWPAFVVRLPSPMLTVDDSNGGPREASVLLAGALPAQQVNEVTTVKSAYVRSPERWWYKLLAESTEHAKEIEALQHVPAIGFFSGLAMWGFNMATELLASANPESGEAYERWDQFAKTERDARVDQVVRALIVGICLHLSNPEELENKSARRGVTITKRSSKQREGDELPSFTEYEVQSSIKINLHHAMRDFVHHGGSSPSVQTLVAGHWKRQAYGPAFSKRQLIHVEPYWRGPLDAPVSDRSR